MNKLILILIIISVFLSFGCITQPVCGDEVCSVGEEISSSPYYCESDCGVSLCAKEGENFSKIFINEYPTDCCEGLTEWDSGMDTRIVENGICVESGLVSGNPVGTCINCGNGVCESIENVCNCPQDCEIDSPQLDLNLGVNIIISRTTYNSNEEVQIK
jgi:hypothetical protein